MQMKAVCGFVTGKLSHLFRSRPTRLKIYTEIPYNHHYSTSQCTVLASLEPNITYIHFPQY